MAVLFPIRKSEAKDWQGLNVCYSPITYINPCGMQVEWRSAECLRDLLIDISAIALSHAGTCDELPYIFPLFADLSILFTRTGVAPAHTPR